MPVMVTTRRTLANRMVVSIIWTGINYKGLVKGSIVRRKKMAKGGMTGSMCVSLEINEREAHAHSRTRRTLRQ